MKYILPILFRYSSLALQFAVVILVTRQLRPEEAGVYFGVFGAINATYFLFGLGLPDGLVRFIAHADATQKQNEIRSMIGQSALMSMIAAAVTVAVGVLVVMCFLESPLVTRTVIGATVAWWCCYGVTFFASQVLVATDRAAQGAFFFYPAMNVALFATSVPYLFFASHPELEITLLAAVGGGVLCAGVAVVFAVVATLSYPPSTICPSIKPVFRLGLSIGISRVLQSCLYWVPVWGVGAWQGAAAVATFATASRLNVAIASIMAAIRFTIRPTIVRFAAKRDWSGIACEGQRAAALATATSIIAIIGVVMVGPVLIEWVFGAAYRDASWILVILLIGTLGECFGGAVDEILKMTARAAVVLRLLIVMLTIEIILIISLGYMGVWVMAAVQALVFVLMYCVMLAIVRYQDGVWVGASLRRR